MQPFIEIGRLQVPTYHLLMVVSHALPAFLFARSFHQGALGDRHSSLWVPLALAGTLAGHLGARLGPSGLTWHWGFIAAALVTCLIAVYFGISLLRLFDTLALPVTLGYGLMRLGCFLAGDGCYGKATDIALGVTFPNGLKPINTSVHPVSLYEGVIMLTFFLFGRYFLQGSRKGVLFSLVAILGGIERFSVEFMRLNPVVCLGLTAAQIISILLIFTGIGVFFWLTHGNSTSDLNIVSVGGYKP